jgi:hypothetical protein
MGAQTPIQSRPSNPAFCAKILLAQVVFLGALVVVEIACRSAGMDFDHQAKAFARLPIYYRQPVVPVGKAFFRRPGPDQWRGKVLTTWLRENGHAERIPGEEEVVIRYDAQGFRNPDGLTDWDVVMAGDSFTELGYLPYEDLFTTRVGEALGLRVKNLGVGYTGTLTQTCYLEQYGKAPSAKHAFVVFFEGNDIPDLLREEDQLAWLQRGLEPKPKLETLSQQPSFIRGVYRALVRRKEKYTSPWNARFVHDGTAVPVRVVYTPPGSKTLSPGQKAMLTSALQGWAEAARALGMKPWLAYMPCKRRVLHGHLEFLGSAEKLLIDWQPTDLPEIVSRCCAGQGVEFVDLTPDLVRQVEGGRLNYNTHDTHLNREGVACVTRTLVTALKGHVADYTARDQSGPTARQGSPAAHSSGRRQEAGAAVDGARTYSP